MKTIDRDDTKQRQVVIPPVPTEFAPEDDSFVWSAEDRINFTEMQASAVVVTDSRPYRTIHQQILFTLLPFILLPLLGMGGLFAFRNTFELPRPEPVTQTKLQHDEHWLDYVILLFLLGGNFGFAMLISNRLSKSFKQISNKLSEAANGNLSAQIEAGENAEFQDVANNFNRLVTKFDRTLQQ